ncbi:MAG: hypothetical protein UY79_C0003G0108 [Parcubacteria group bacterium GW2011_GWA2_53_21]|nr:MAG: hypothetical protein UY79_C0003G0108 [Parcubacteria group bacterium GW2011_GWA2_53_21]
MRGTAGHPRERSSGARSDVDHRLDGHIHHAVDLGGPVRGGAVVGGDELAAHDPRTQEDAASEGFGRVRPRVENGERLHTRVEPPLDDEGLLPSLTLGEPHAPGVLALRGAHEDAQRARREVVRAGDLENQQVARLLGEVTEALQVLDGESGDGEREAVLSVDDEVRLWEELHERGEVLISQVPSEGIFELVEEGEPALVAEVGELRDHPDLALLGGADEIGEQTLRLEDGELPPDRAHALSVELDAAVGDLDVLETVGRHHARVEAAPSQLLHEPAGGGDVGRAPVRGDDEDEGAVLVEPGEAGIPLVPVEAVRLVHVVEVGEAAGHLVVLGGDEPRSADVHVGATHAP